MMIPLIGIIIVIASTVVSFKSLNNGEKIRPTGEKSKKDWLTTLLLCAFAGGLGLHRFYAGKIGTGLLYLYTLGCFGIGTIFDLIKIVSGTFIDGEGNTITNKEISKNTNPIR